jgi:hypothetical protein
VTVILDKILYSTPGIISVSDQHSFSADLDPKDVNADLIRIRIQEPPEKKPVYMNKFNKFLTAIEQGETTGLFHLKVAEKIR